MFGIAICLLTAPTFAEEPFNCNKLSKGEFRVYRSLGPAVNNGQTASLRIKKGAIVVDEKRALLTDRFKPEGELGAVIPYKQAQLFFSRYVIEGQEKICSTQRHEDVFGSGEQKQQYLLRCLIDMDSDGQFEAFHRYGELVSYDFNSGKTGTAIGTPQSDHALTQPLKLLATEAPESAINEMVPVVRSVIQIAKVTKSSITLRSISQATIMASELNEQSIDDRIPSLTVEMPLLDSSTALVGRTKISIARSSSGWQISMPDGFANEAELICGGTALDTRQAITVFVGGGLQTFQRNPTYDSIRR